MATPTKDSPTKETFKKMLDEQNQLMDTLVKNANSAMELFHVDTKAMEQGMDLARTYFDQSRALAEDMMKPENMEKFYEKAPAFYTKAMDMNTEFFNKTLEYYRNLWQGFAPETAQTTAKKFAELTQDSAKAIADTTTAQAKLAQEAYA